MEKITPVKAVKVRLMCDECGEEMKPNGRVLYCNPLLYPHQCSNGHAVNVNKSYPCIDFADGE